MLETLRAEVCKANQDLAAHGLAPLTWGNVSGRDPDSGCIVIKPSGVAYADLTPETMVVLAPDGRVETRTLRPSSDAPTHLLLYRHFPAVHGIAHMHSPAATTFSQARMPLPCLGTTHADHFMGTVPVARPLSPDEVAQAYEHATGVAILECFADLDPLRMPAVLVAGHAPFTWGRDAAAAVQNAVALEAVAEMAWRSRMLLGGDPPELEAHVLEAHFRRKHGPDAYYGQAAKGAEG